MITEFALAWRKFKSKDAQALFQDYLKRIGYSSECKIVPLPLKREAGSQLWICNCGPGATMLSSDELSQKLEKLRDAGTRKLMIGIGGADGFTKNDLENFCPEFQWSFGPMTLPHELAAVVAAEQIYRAWTILHHLPYHKAH